MSPPKQPSQLAAGWDRRQVFRANPQYSLVAAQVLPERDRQMLGELANDPDFYGVLLPATGLRLSVKAVQSGDAHLFRTLQTPQPIPAEFARSVPEVDDYLTRLVLDRVLEVRAIDGSFSSGAELFANQQPARTGEPISTGHSVSDRALRYAAQLGLHDPLALAGRLYAYNRLPVSLAGRQKWTQRNEAKDFLQLHTARLDGRWLERTPSEDSQCWISWTGAKSRDAAVSPFKLYICLAAHALPDVFSLCAAAFADHGAFAFKVAADWSAMCRPDKFVAYFNSREELAACARSLGPLLKNLEAHELPFAGELELSALRWGVDPPKGQFQVPWIQESSWRCWVAHKLAAALALAQLEDCTVDAAVEFAKHRVALDGIDTATWAPSPELF